jgi:hypothetical protein
MAHASISARPSPIIVHQSGALLRAGVSIEENYGRNKRSHRERPNDD